MNVTAGEIANWLQGSIKGDESKIISGPAGLEEANDNQISFLKDNNRKASFNQYLSTKAGVVIVQRGTKPNKTKTLIEVENPQKAFSIVLSKFEQTCFAPGKGVHSLAIVAKSAKIGSYVTIDPFAIVEEGAIVGDGTVIGPYCYIGHHSTLGSNCLIYPRVTIRNGVKIGNNCILHPGVVIGADGYGFFFDGNEHRKIPQIGGVIIEDDVEVGANSTIDRGTTGSTIIGKGTKIDNLVQIAHNVKIGRSCLIVAQVGIGGSSIIEDGVVLAGQAGVADHIRIHAGTQVGGQAGVNRNIDKKSVLFGTPAIPLSDSLKQQIYIRKLPQFFKDQKK